MLMDKNWKAHSIRRVDTFFLNCLISRYLILHYIILCRTFKIWSDYVLIDRLYNCMLYNLFENVDTV